MKKQVLLTLLAAVLLVATFGSDPAQAQGTVLPVIPDIQGTLGQNDWFVDTVTVSFPGLDPSWTIVEGCQTTVIDEDTTAARVPITCVVTADDGGPGAVLSISNAMPPHQCWSWSAQPKTRPAPMRAAP